MQRPKCLVIQPYFALIKNIIFQLFIIFLFLDESIVYCVAINLKRLSLRVVNASFYLFLAKVLRLKISKLF